MSDKKSLAVLLGTAKATPTFTLSPVGFSSAVLMPTTLPWQSMRGPPELPGFTGVSVWIMSLIGRELPFGLNVRPVALTIPSVSVPSRLNGFPMARTGSPARSASESPSEAGGRAGPRPLHPDDRQVIAGIAAQRLRGKGGAVRELHLQAVGAGDHVFVGEDGALVVDDDAAAHTLRLGA